MATTFIWLQPTGQGIESNMNAHAERIVVWWVASHETWQDVAHSRRDNQELIRVTDMPETVEWYCEKFGMPTAFAESGQNFLWFISHAQSNRFHWQQTRSLWAVYHLSWIRVRACECAAPKHWAQWLEHVDFNYYTSRFSPAICEEVKGCRARLSPLSHLRSPAIARGNLLQSIP